jgi:hypothetical protein
MPCKYQPGPPPLDILHRIQRIIGTGIPRIKCMPARSAPRFTLCSGAISRSPPYIRDSIWENLFSGREKIVGRYNHLRRRALVYVRQSCMDQVLHNQESQIRQYSLASRARELGFREVTVIDDDPTLHNLNGTFNLGLVAWLSRPRRQNCY